MTFVSDWIPRHLSTQTQIQLRLTMEKSPSNSDSAGYIYVYSLKDDNQKSNIAQYKVGRTVNVNRRIDNWIKQCDTSNQFFLRGYFPSSPLSSSRLHTTFAVMDPNLKCMFVHKLESE